MAHGRGPDRPLDGGEKSDPAGGGFVCRLAEYSSRREHQRRGGESETANPLADMHIRLLAVIIHQPAGVAQRYRSESPFSFAANSDDQATPAVAQIAGIADARSNVGFGLIETITEGRKSFASG
jgi:hypothetical protein